MFKELHTPDIVEIDRRIWLRGLGSENSGLCRKVQNKYKFCCLGICALKAGCEVSDLSSKVLMDFVDLFQHKKILIKEFVYCDIDNNYCNKDIADKLMIINDAVGLDQEARECKLTELFKELNIKVIFSN